jgi:signal transduction histidine kinase
MKAMTMRNEQNDVGYQVARLAIPDADGDFHEALSPEVSDALLQGILPERRLDKQMSRLQRQDVSNACEDDRPQASKPQRLESLTRISHGLREVDLRQIADDLHDNLAQSLCVASFSLGMLSGKIGARLSPSEQGQLTSIRECVADALAEVRRITTDFRSTEPTDADIVAAVARLCARVAAGYEEISMHWRLDADDDIPPALRLPLYRILQESLNNACRHAQARRIDVVLDADAEGVHLEINDDGIGFDPTQEAQRPTPGCLGLTSMRRRARLSNGRFLLSTTPGVGTRIRVTWPRAGAS